MNNNVSDFSNYYFLLNVEQTATTQDIIKSYRNLCRLAKTNNIIKFYINQIKMAYIILSNPKTREDYDNQLKNLQNQNIETIDSENDINFYSDYKPEGTNNETLREIDKQIHNQNNIKVENVEKLRNVELNILVKNLNSNANTTQQEFMNTTDKQ